MRLVPRQGASSTAMGFVRQLCTSPAKHFLRAEYGLFINGASVPAASGRTFAVENPASGEHVCHVAEGSEEDVALAVENSHAAFLDGRWSKLHSRARAKVLTDAAQLLREKHSEMVHVECVSTGRCIKEMNAQLVRVPEWLEYFAAIAQGMEGSVPPFSDDNHLNYIRHKPLGVCGLITPWNHPLLIAVKKVAPALAAGNTIVVKPSELAPVAVIELGRLLHQAGLPPGVMNVVPGFGHTAGRALTNHQALAKLDLTGGTATGRVVAAAAGSNLARVCMELGGNAPVLVFEDADVDTAVAGVAFGAFVASGQTCVSAKRILVHNSLVEEFTGKLISKAEGIRMGQPLCPDTQMGPVVSEQQMETVLRLVESARQEGAVVSTGGIRAEGDLACGYFVPPTVITEVSTSMTCFQEEIFGPVVTVVGFEDEADAVSKANDCKYALGAAIWTQNVSRAHRVARDVDAGIIWINAHHRNDPSSPWGGFKDSGMGKENGWECLREYMDSKSVVVPLDETPFDWFGGSKRYG